MITDPSSWNASMVTVRIFGSLQPLRTERGLPCTLTVEIPQDGMGARDLAVSLGLPPEEIEGVFVNHVVHGVDVRISPGDRVAFVPFGTPGPHRVFLGLYAAGKEERDAPEDSGRCQTRRLPREEADRSGRGAGSASAADGLRRPR
jgi:hypothetical protein